MEIKTIADSCKAQEYPKKVYFDKDLKNEVSKEKAEQCLFLKSVHSANNSIWSRCFVYEVEPTYSSVDIDRFYSKNLY